MHEHLSMGGKKRILPLKKRRVDPAFNFSPLPLSSAQILLSRSTYLLRRKTGKHKVGQGGGEESCRHQPWVGAGPGLGAQGRQPGTGCPEVQGDPRAANLARRQLCEVTCTDNARRSCQSWRRPSHGPKRPKA